MTTGPTNPSLAESREGAVSLADGLIEVATDQGDAPDLAQTLATVGKRWQQGKPAMQRAIDRQDRLRLRPQAYRFYRTGSDALVFVCGIDVERDARCHVLVSDPDHVTGFSTQGSAYWVYANGMASKKSNMNAITGDWLMEALPWKVHSLEVEPAEQAANKSYGRWLPKIDGRAPISLKAAGLWATHNGSIVAVSRRPNGQWGATVARGGHELPDLAGTGPGSNYSLAESGAVVWKVKGSSGDEMRTLAIVSGMALLRAVDVLDGDGKPVEILPDSDFARNALPVIAR